MYVNRMTSNIKSWAEEDRPREKMMLKGRSALSDAELLAILIGSGTRELTAVELAREILNHSNNSLDELAQKSIKELMKFKGIGEAKAITLYASMEIARRKSFKEERKKFKIGQSRDAYNYLKADLMDLAHEEFYALFLNRRNEVIDKVQISKGGMTGTVADGKVIFNKALEIKAVSIILAHNHPSGNLNPSEQDMKLTKSLVSFGKLIDLLILDHIIVTDQNYYSFAENNKI